MKIIVKILKYLFIGVLSIYLTFIIGGLIIKRQGQSEIDQASVKSDHAKIVTDKYGRKIEYFLYGSSSPNAPVVINMHGSGLDGTFEKAVNQTACEELGLRGIAISLPGVGNTDMKIGRKVIDWASEDLQAVLDAENVDTFMITGHSQGNPHAMAAAYHFKDRVTGLGLNAPLLPNDVTNEIGIAGALAYESLKTTAELDEIHNAYWFFGLYLYVDLFAPYAPTETLVSMGKNVKNDTVLVEMMRHTFGRSMVRGSAGNTWESAVDVAYLWGFDPREIDTKNICVWHASDDTACPPEIGAWLAKFYTEKGAHVNFKNNNIGFNHMTFCSSYYRESKHSMVKALLEGKKIPLVIR
ncbi:alpha/beta hydrolase [Flavobacteriaceae bacterium]|nr:alpha/beta hydrolase [Flavobacteriaceae bacterium]